MNQTDDQARFDRMAATMRWIDQHTAGRSLTMASLSMACEMQGRKYPDRVAIHGALFDLYGDVEAALQAFATNVPYVDGHWLTTERVGPLLSHLETFTGKLLQMKETYPIEALCPNMESRDMASDCFVLLGQYANALDFFRPFQIGARASFAADRILSLKLAIGDHLIGRDVLMLCGPRVTAFGKKRLSEIVECLDILLEARRRETEINYLPEWAKDSRKQAYPAFNGTPYVYYFPDLVKIPLYAFSDNQQAIEFVVSLTREAENTVREEMGIPRVGEGWVAETQLYYEIKTTLPNMAVQQHASPEWLGRQHLDIFIPELGVAIEYQGLQHDQPVAYFGGQEAYERNRKRDLRKRRLCARHSIAIIHVRPGYVLQDVVDEIQRAGSGRIVGSVRDG
jgi:hypothetical protein